jgi:hypothetical protein
MTLIINSISLFRYLLSDYAIEPKPYEPPTQNQIMYFNDNNKLYPPSTPTRSRSNSYKNTAPFSSLSVSTPNDNEDYQSDISSNITPSTEVGTQVPPQFLHLSHLNEHGRPNSAPPSFHSNLYVTFFPSPHYTLLIYAVISPYPDKPPHSHENQQVLPCNATNNFS